MKKNILLFLSVCVSLSSFAQDTTKYLTQEPPENKNMKPEETEYYTPVPPVVTPGKQAGDAPSDAIVLFDGKNLDSWVSSKDASSPAPWTVKDGNLTVKPGSGAIHTKQSFADCQLHIEFKEPEKITGDGQERGNSGIFLQSNYELQVLDSYHNSTYVNGQSGSVYKEYPPLVNVSRPPGEWQSYDVVYKAPLFNADGSLISPASITVFQNGVLVQNNVAITGMTLNAGKQYYKAHGPLPLELQDHSFLVSFRNIWIRPLK